MPSGCREEKSITPAALGGGRTTMTSSPQDNEVVEFVRLPEVKRMTGLGTTTIYKLANAGTFPKQVPLGGRAVAWVRSEICAWTRAKVEAAR
ncbi:helix-turn-helix transcriptional regulator [Pseudomonas turukhanskensis]|uniref:helix-turn-helix transcriptional regulator n=1 Tax=Pseudomonas turukhanskensis TaxID=1806536 RepID=UPI00285285D8|nr:AlpA family transcriptional regulator [Pseudomonas turukhanskensis]